MKDADIYSAMRRLDQRLRDAGIDYALIGGMALLAHGFRRFTDDVDLLMTKEGLSEFRERLLGRGYLPAFEGAEKSFKDTEANVRVEVVTSGEYPGDGKTKPVVFPDPRDSRVELDGIAVLSLEKLVELKLASGLSAPHRIRDIADVQDLIRILELPLELSSDLDGSVTSEYERLWHTVQAGKEESR